MSVLFFVHSSSICQAQTAIDSTGTGHVDSSVKISAPIPEKLPKWKFIRALPGDVWQMAKSPFRPGSWKALSVVAASSALLIWKDQQILDAAMRFGRQINLDPQTSYNVLVKAGTTKIIKVPKNINTALYQFGEGGTSMIIAGGMFIYGKIAKDRLALKTASDLTEGFLLMGFSTQVLKRISGRESPFARTRPGGRWQPFPSFKEYQTNTSNYDAFPSGHLATLMCTVTILAENYPHSKWIRPVGYSMMGLVSFAMMNTEVHWAGDYPLALLLGYVSGKIVSGTFPGVNKKKKKALALF